ncbi:hypothetical protein Q5P01_001196 [Channa striata]|uniref:Pentraxin n=1 Tax=Channa striata TaxID=64152 RepID=A0AA88T509_CHASR|nr:hypothetical protein Q5P01_001196 [Channa striata]
MRKMKNTRLFVPLVQLIFMMGVTNGQTTAGGSNCTTTRPVRTTTTASPGLNLKGKMFTLSLRGGDISFSSPYFTPPNMSPITTHTPETTASSRNGVSVCVRYITDYLQTTSPSLFTLSPSNSPLCLKVSDVTKYSLNPLYVYNYLFLKPNVRFWPNVKSDFWTSVCLTVDTGRNVAQMFQGPNMSIRKQLPFQYVWSGEPVITFSGFDGQVTDVQVWDYPLHYGEIYNYMAYGAYGSYQGSVLSWSNVKYSIRGNTLLEDAYGWQDKQPISKGKGRRLKGGKRTRRFFTKGEDMEKQEI